MLDNEPTNSDTVSTDSNTDVATPESSASAPAKKAARKAPAKRAPRKAAARDSVPQPLAADATPPAGSTERIGADLAGQPADATESASVQVPAKATRTRRTAAKKASEPALAPSPAPDSDAAPESNPEPDSSSAPTATAPSAVFESAPAKRAPRKRAAKAAPATPSAAEGSSTDVGEVPVARARPRLGAPSVLFQTPAEPSTPVEPASASVPALEEDAGSGRVSRRRTAAKATAKSTSRTRGRAGKSTDEPTDETPSDLAESGTAEELADELNEDLAAEAEAAAEDESARSDEDGIESGEGGNGRRRRRRGRRGRGSRGGDGVEGEPTGDVERNGATQLEDELDEEEEGDHAEEVAEAALSASARRRRRRRRSGGGDGLEASSEDDPPNTVVHVRETKSAGARGSEADSDGVRGVKGSTRLEAKRQRRRDNRDTGRRRAPILTEAEFLARRESVDRVMAVRQTGDRTQIAVLEDGILVEHYVTRASSQSAVGNVYLGRVQNVLPSMEAAFVDIGRGRNGVLYAGEVNWDAAGLEGKSRAIENAMSSGDTVLVQVTKDPIGHKGARLTSQVSLPGRFVVYVPGGGMTGISRKLPDVERTRLKAILKKVIPDDAGVIVRTAAEGASEADLISDVERLKAQWESIQAKANEPGSGPSMVYGEPDLAIRVVRDVFNDDFKKLIVAGADIRTTISDYVSDVAPDLADRISLHTAETDLFNDLRVDEQLAKALDRKVYLPSGGSLVIDRTEAMVVIDVNTGKYTGSGGNLEQTVTRNNLEAAEEIVRQLRLRDIGGIVVIDFIDMVLESNRDLVLRRLTECLGRDRTKHQVAEVTSLGLVQMTRKRVGEGLLEAFSEPCEHCKGRGVIVHSEPVDLRSAPLNGSSPNGQADEEEQPTSRGKRSRRSKNSVAIEPKDEAALAAEAERRRAAANAVAAIAAATSQHTDSGPAGAADADQTNGAAPDAVAPSGAAPDTVAPSGAAPDTVAPNGAAPDAVAPDAVAPDAVGAGNAEPQQVAGVVAAGFAASSTQTSPDNAVGSSGRPRRRRAASRPAGPPAAITTGSHAH